ncbi:MAG TPA: DUF3369 domain-containing protein [Thioploca sp.]|nr:DUF3369 domain-containing protein [Thioploca sp.]
MKKLIKMSDDDDELLFSEQQEEEILEQRDVWKVMIVDDESSVHDVTKLALQEFSYAGKKLEFIHAFSAQTAKHAMTAHPDIAVILLDVVMENEQAGLELVKYIRDEQQNRFVRIILRTGQPGQAPERQVILDYDVDDYKEKTELTANKLFTTLVTALRTYQDMMTINRNRLGLKKIIDATPSLFKFQSIEKFISGLLEQILSILNLDCNAFYCHTCEVINKESDDNLDKHIIAAGTGYYEDKVNKYVKEVVDESLLARLRLAYQTNQTLYFDDECVINLRHANNYESIVYLKGAAHLDEIDKQLIETFCANVAIAYDNLFLNQEMIHTEKKLIELLHSATEKDATEKEQHLTQITEYLQLLCKKYGLNEQSSGLQSFSFGKTPKL